MVMDEVFLSQFTTSTTCYSGSRDSSTLRFATETHSLQLRLDVNDASVTYESLQDDGDDNDEVDFHNNKSNKKKSDMTCVGHSSCTNSDNRGIWEAVGLMHVEQQQQQQQHQQSQSSSVGTDSSSVVTLPTTQQQQHQQQHTDGSTPQHHKHHQRRLTHDGTLTAVAAAVFPNTSDASNSSTFQRSSWAHHHHPQPLTTANTATNRTGTTSVLRLTLRRPSTNPATTPTTTTPVEADTSSVLERCTSHPLSFRPLAPCVSQWTVQTTAVGSDDDDDDDDDNSNTSIVITGVWVGSADDNLLRLYLASDSSLGGGARLVEKRLDHAGFIVQSPVMALDFFSRPEQQQQQHSFLALACQDGTIRLLEFQCRGTKLDWNFVNVQEYTVIVDGPIVCLHWNYKKDQQQENGNILQVVAGSLCGYVCSLERTTGGEESASSNWQGPNMVAQGFWDERLQTEDSVLAVHAYQKYVVFGTYSGRVWVYELQSTSGMYQVIWKCSLSYPIHGVCLVHRASDDDNSSSTTAPSLVVTTRRTIHVFRDQQEAPTRLSLVSSSQHPQYSAQLAKQRLELLMVEHNLTL